MRLLIDIEVPLFDCIYRDPRGVKRTLLINMVFQLFQVFLYILVAFGFTDDDIVDTMVIQRVFEGKA